MLIDTNRLYFYVRDLGIKETADSIRKEFSAAPAEWERLDFAGIDGIAKRIIAELKTDPLLEVVVKYAVAGIPCEKNQWPNEDASKVFQTKHFKGKSYGQISKMTGDKPEAVRKTYKRAHQALSRLFTMIDNTRDAIEDVKKEAKRHFKKIPRTK